MKYFCKLFIISLISFITLGSCDNMNIPNTVNKYPTTLYKGSKWDAVQLNDSIIMLIPGLNGSNESKPLVIDIRNFNKSEVEPE